MALIGVAGGSGSGKTTFASQLCEFLELENAAILLQDSYYKDHSKVFKGDGSVNFDHPEALDWDLLFQHLKALKSGQAIEVPIYNFTTHSREDRTRRQEPKKHIIVDGILILAVPKLADLFDVKVFVETAEPLRFERRLERDVKERGRTKEGVLAQYQKTVLPMHDEFVEPSKENADLVMSGETPFQVSAFEDFVKKFNL